MNMSMKMIVGFEETGVVELFHLHSFSFGIASGTIGSEGVIVNLKPVPVKDPAFNDRMQEAAGSIAFTAVEQVILRGPDEDDADGTGPNDDDPEFPQAELTAGKIRALAGCAMLYRTLLARVGDINEEFFMQATMAHFQKMLLADKIIDRWLHADVDAMIQEIKADCVPLFNEN